MSVNVVDISRLLVELKKRSESLLNRKICLVGPGETIYARGEASNLNRAFWAILINSHEAMQNKADKPVNITLNVDANLSTVDIRIQDFGEGLTPEAQLSSCEPFFTTKDGHEGLGLADAYSVVVTCGGQIKLENGPESGCTVTVYLLGLTNYPKHLVG